MNLFGKSSSGSSGGSGSSDKGGSFREAKKGNFQDVQLHANLDQTLSCGDLAPIVRLPPGEDELEWIAVNTFDLYNQTNLLYGALADFCTNTSCPAMSAGPKYEYLWADGNKIKKPIKVTAPEYVGNLFAWVHENLENEELFPVLDGQPFPKNFKAQVKQIMKRMWRVYAHLYYSHAQEIVNLGIEPHVNTSFKHFYLFIQEFNLVEAKELEPLKVLTTRIDQRMEQVSRKG